MSHDPSVNDDAFIDAVASALKGYPDRPEGAIDAIRDAIRDTPTLAPSDRSSSTVGRGRVWAVAMTVVAAAASLVLLLRLPAGTPQNGEGRMAVVAASHTEGAAAAELDRSPEPTQFVYVDSGASGVSVVGSFNGWDPDALPLQRDPTGIWSTETPLPPGRHLFAYVVDGEWRVDERAPKAPDNEFGLPSSVVVVSSDVWGAL